MLLIKYLLLFFGSATFTLILWTLFLCIKFEKDNNLKSRELTNKKVPFARLTLIQKKVLHFIITMIIISVPLIYVFYQHINQEVMDSSDWSIFAKTLLILVTVLTTHSYLFPMVNRRYTWRWGKKYKLHLKLKKQESKQLKLNL